MKRARLLAVAFSLLLGAWPGARAHAAIVYFNQVSSGNWNVPSNWSTGTVPTSSDRAVIVGNRTCNVTGNASIDTISVQSGATLNVNSGITLTLYNLVDNLGTGGANDSYVDGDVVVAGSSGGGGTQRSGPNPHGRPPSPP
jgi:hypothetical protein